MLAAGLTALKLGLIKGSWLPLHHVTPACLCLHQIAQGIMRGHVGAPLKMGKVLAHVCGRTLHKRRALRAGCCTLQVITVGHVPKASHQQKASN